MNLMRLLGIKTYTRLNAAVYTLSGGRLMNNINGSPICVVRMRGAKSGKKRVICLMYTEHGEDVLLVASLGGAPKHPLWYHNLMAYPDIKITQRGHGTRKMHVTQATPEQKAALWPTLVESYPPFEAYQKRTERDIPVLICSPRD